MKIKNKNKNEKFQGEEKINEEEQIKAPEESNKESLLTEELKVTEESQVTEENGIEIKNIEGLEYLKTIENNSINLILTDPPYIISRESGMNSHYNKVQNILNREKGPEGPEGPKEPKESEEFVKTESEWIEYKKNNGIKTDENKYNYMKFGTIYGKKYCVRTDYGDWDNNFTIEILEKFISEFYKKLKKGGTLIIFFDLWKIETLKNILEKYKFKQIRLIEWIKTNPQPLNSKVNYLTNCREIALTCIKESKPTFNSQYDNGIYFYPLQGGKNRFHPTQKSLQLFEELIKKHSNENDVILDTFLGAGTTAIAAKNTNRQFKGCEISLEYFDKVMEIIKK
jgi:site-specific DNA-methyltransferase (adenine-specific)